MQKTLVYPDGIPGFGPLNLLDYTCPQLKREQLLNAAGVGKPINTAGVRKPSNAARVELLHQTLYHLP